MRVVYRRLVGRIQERLQRLEVPNGKELYLGERVFSNAWNPRFCDNSKASWVQCVRSKMSMMELRAPGRRYGTDVISVQEAKPPAGKLLFCHLP